MITYPHFAISGLVLRNGYREHTSADGMVREYYHANQLELCIRRLLLRKPERLRGWDLRFLRRGLDLLQAEFGKMIDRDAQTVARLEKSGSLVPAYVDLAIRARFAERFDPPMQVRELLKYVDGTASILPKKIELRLVGSTWICDLLPAPTFAVQSHNIVFVGEVSPEYVIGLKNANVTVVSSGSIAEIHPRSEFSIAHVAGHFSHPLYTYQSPAQPAERVSTGRTRLTNLGRPVIFPAPDPVQ